MSMGDETLPLFAKAPLVATKKLGGESGGSETPKQIETDNNNGNKNFTVVLDCTAPSVLFLIGLDYKS